MLKRESSFKLQQKILIITLVQWTVFLLTIIAIFIYPILPERKVTITPSNQTASTFYFPELQLGTTMQWVDKEAGHWQCNINNKRLHNQCGVYLNWSKSPYSQGRDLANFSHVKLNLHYQGSAKNIRVYLRNFDEKFAIVSDKNSAQYLFTEFKTSQLINHKISIPVAEITVADWWLSQYQHPRDYAQPKFNNINTFGIEVFGENLNGEHHMVIKTIEFTGPFINEKRYYLTILITWLFCVFFHLMSQLFITRKFAISLSEKEQLLVRTNKILTREKEKYHQLSMLDALTQIPNRHGFEEFILKTIPITASDAALIILDVDHFKKINDSYGHDVGDLALKKLASLLKENIRGDDYFARWGGEEFIICCLNTSLDDSYRLAEKLRLIAQQAAFSQKFQLAMTVSLGVAIRDPHESIKHWFNRTDQALYLAKNEGRNKTVSG